MFKKKGGNKRKKKYAFKTILPPYAYLLELELFSGKTVLVVNAADWGFDSLSE